MLSFIHYWCHPRQFMDVLQWPVVLIFDILLLVNSLKAYPYICLCSLASTFSSPEPKARVSYCPSSVRRPSVRRKLPHFRLLLWNRWTESNETWQKARSQRPRPSFCFSSRSEKQDGRPNLWLAETFLMSSLNRWTEFNETWQEAKSQRLLPRLCFYRLIGKTRWPPQPLIRWDIFDYFSETA